MVQRERRSAGVGAAAQGRLGTDAQNAVPNSSSDELMWRALACTHEVVHIIDAEGHLLYRKDPREQRTDNLQRWIQFWDDRSQAAAGAAFAEARAGQTAGFEGLSPAFDGSPKWWAVTIAPFRNHNKDVTRLLVSARDITEQRQSREELQRVRGELEKLRNELVQIARVETLRVLGPGIAHELKQPLAAIRSNAQYTAQTLNGGGGFDVVREALADIVRDTDRASEVIDHFRAFMQRASPVLAPCDVDVLVSDVVSLVRPEATKRQIHVETQIDHVPKVNGDRILLQQLLLNLIGNAVEAVDDPAAVSRTVTIRTSRGSLGAIVSVEDRGALIADESFKRIEEPFYSSKAHGFGFGLPVCRHILALHGSQLRVTRSPAAGLVFSFELPAGRPH